MKLPLTRRGFLKLGTSRLAAGGLLATMGGFQRALAAADTSGYRALVCVFLNGGNDSFNMLVPRDGDGYSAYASARRGMALAQSELLPIDAPNQVPLGLHPRCAPLQALFARQRLAFVSNVGPLQVPVTRQQVLAQSAPLPNSLFSHSDQQGHWMSCRGGSTERYGWAGRIADLLAAQAGDPRLLVNFAVGSGNVWQSGRSTLPYVLSSTGATRFNVLNTPNSTAQARRRAFLSVLQAAAQHPAALVRELAHVDSRAIESAGRVNAALAACPDLATPFPGNWLGAQLKVAARMIQARTTLGHSRQIFMIDFGDFDTHNDQLPRQASLLGQLGNALKAFHDATQEMGVAAEVTTFTASEFGRTLTSNGDGTDHGWGGHQMVMGGAVQGGTVTGRLPELVLGGPDDAGGGRIIPAIATDQYAATLARWFGLGNAELDLVFPNLAHFGQRDLGFMRR